MKANAPRSLSPGVRRFYAGIGSLIVIMATLFATCVVLVLLFTGR